MNSSSDDARLLEDMVSGQLPTMPALVPGLAPFRLLSDGTIKLDLCEYSSRSLIQRSFIQLYSVLLRRDKRDLSPRKSTEFINR
jgi:hypothetical protein